MIEIDSKVPSSLVSVPQVDLGGPEDVVLQVGGSAGDSLDAKLPGVHARTKPCTDMNHEVMNPGIEDGGWSAGTPQIPHLFPRSCPTYPARLLACSHVASPPGLISSDDR